MSLETVLRERRSTHPLFVPYVTAGVRADWLDIARMYVDEGADAIEIGLPFSDPMLDGATIQASSQQALDAGMTPERALAELARLRIDVPLAAMAYTNTVLQEGFWGRLRDSGCAGLIPVDTSFDESGPLVAAAGEDLEVVLLVAPSTPPDRVRRIAERSRGFVYAAGVMGTTGERRTLAETAAGIAGRVRERTDRPVLLGFGISTPGVAAEAARHADGVVVGAGLMRPVLDGASLPQLGALVGAFRSALGR